VTAAPRIRPRYATAAAILLMAMLGTLYAWSVFVEPLESRFAQSRSLISAIFSAAIVAFTIGMLVGHRFYGALSAPAIAVLTGAVAAAGLALAAAGDSVWLVAAGYGGLFGLANGIGYGLSLQIIQNADARSRGLVTGVAVASYTLGPALAAPFLAASIASYGLQATFLPLAGAIGAAGLLAAWLIRQSHVAVETRSMAITTPAPRATRQFAVLWLSFLLIGAVGVMVLGHAAPMAASFGAAGSEPGLAVTLVTIGNGVGRLAGGWYSERIRPPAILVGAPLLIALALAGLLAAPAVAALLCALFIIGLGYGTVASAFPMIVAKGYGARNVSRIYGRLFTAWGVAGLAAPFLGGVLFDARGDYANVIIAAAALAALASLVGLAYPRQAAIRSAVTAE
jgi:predicted MFS family arabinose efflux permease